MTGPSVGDLEFQLRAGQITRNTGCPGACDGQLFDFPINGNASDDMCPYITPDDVIASPKYANAASGQAVAGDLLVVCDPTAFNGRQCVRMPGKNTSPFHTLKMADIATATTDVWFRGRHRISLPLGPQGYTLSSVAMSAPPTKASSFSSLGFSVDGTVDPGFGGHYTGQLVVTVGDSVASFGFKWQPMSSIALVDGESWDLVGHVQRNLATHVTTYHAYCRRSDGSGSWQSLAWTGTIAGDSSNTGLWQATVMGTPHDPSQYVDTCTIEYVDGSLHADPFGVGA